MTHRWLAALFFERQVINTLGMSKEETSEVLDTFDVELLALSRLRSPHIVQVCQGVRLLTTLLVRR